MYVPHFCGALPFVLTTVGWFVWQEEMRPEYEEALQEKKAKMKAQSKKKVVYQTLCVSDTVQ